jgi:hypothetical protein
MMQAYQPKSVAGRGGEGAIQGVMPLYFAYGSNMDVKAMAERCPRSTPLGPARLARHRFFIMDSGWASVCADPRRDVHGVLWDLALSDVRVLDKYEDIHSGLYQKIMQPVLRGGGASARALVYVGGSLKSGAAQPGYMEQVVAAARDWSLPEIYLRELQGFVSAHPRAGAAPAWKAPDGSAQSAQGVKVRPRFATPFDKGRP